MKDIIKKARKEGKGTSLPETAKVNYVFTRYRNSLRTLENKINKTKCNPEKSTFIFSGCFINTNPGFPCKGGRTSLNSGGKDLCCHSSKQRVSEDLFCEEHQDFKNKQAEHNKPLSFIKKFQTKK